MRTLQKVLTGIAVGVLSVALAAPAAAQETEATSEAMEPAPAVPIEGNLVGDHDDGGRRSVLGSVTEGMSGGILWLN